MLCVCVFEKMCAHYALFIEYLCNLHRGVRQQNACVGGMKEEGFGIISIKFKSVAPLCF